MQGTSWVDAVICARIMRSSCKVSRFRRLRQETRWDFSSSFSKTSAVVHTAKVETVNHLLFYLLVLIEQCQHT